MKITSIRTYVLKAPLDGGQRFWSSQRHFDHRKSMLVRIETNDGLVGWGEGGQHGPAEPVATTIHDVLAPMLLGADPCQPETLWERMYVAMRDFGRSGPIMEAMSAIDIALWDIFGKQQQLPIHRLMGGAFRNRVKVYATGFYYRGEAFTTADHVEQSRQEAAQCAALGFSGVKVKIGLLPVIEDMRRIEAVRETLGAEVLLMVDANHAYSAHAACSVAAEMERYRVCWFEEPVVPEDYDGYRQVKNSTRIAVAGGECEHTRFGFARWIEQRLLDIVQPDPCCAGGLSELRRIAALASTFHVQCLPHVWGSGVALAAGLQFIAQIPPSPYTANPMALLNEPLLEWDCSPNPLREELLVQQIEAMNGEVAVPVGPGLGIEVDEPVLRRYTIAERESAWALQSVSV